MQPHTPPTSRRWKWLRRGALILLVLLALATVAVQIVLWTDLPRRLVLAEVQKALGLRVAAERLSISWGGTTRLRQVALTLPLAEQSFFDVPELVIEHTSLPVLILRRAITVESITLLSPKLVVMQAANGRWNVQEVAELVGRAGGGRAAEPGRNAPPALPRLRIDDARVRVIDAHGREAVIGPLALHGFARDPFVWQYELSVPGRVSAKGEVAPGGQWPHRVELAIRELDPWLRPWVAHWPQPTELDAVWTGQRKGEGVAGELSVRNLRVNQYAAAGPLQAYLGDDALSISPRGLKVELGGSAGPVDSLRLESGRLILRSAGAVAEALHLSLAGGVARLSGQWDAVRQSANGELRWDDLRWPAGLSQSGRMELSLRTPWPGRPRVQAVLHSLGTLPEGKWDAALNIEGEGESWTEMDWRLALRTLDWRGRRPVKLHDLSVELALRGRKLALQRIDVPAPWQAGARGELDLSSRNYWLWVDGRSLPLPRGDAAVAVMLNAWGDGQTVRVQQFYARRDDIELTAGGYYHAGRPKPLEIDLYLHQPPHDVQNITRENKPWDAILSSEAHLTGTLWPIDLTMEGKLAGKNLSVSGRVLGDVTMRLGGVIGEQYADVELSDLSLLGGRWHLRGRYPTTFNDEATHIDLAVQGLELEQVGRLAGTSVLGGRLDGRWQGELVRPRLDDLTVTGEFSADNVSAGALVSRRINGGVSLRGGQLEISPLRLVQGEGRTEGRMWMDLFAPRVFNADLKSIAWPVRVGEIQVQIDADAQAVVDLRLPAAEGGVNLRAAATYRDKPLGQVNTRVALHSQGGAQALAIEDFRAEVLEGTLEGSGAYRVNDLASARLDLRWSGVEAARVADLWPTTAGLSGTLDGELRIGPARPEDRLPEPMRLDLLLRPQNLRLRGMEFGPAEAAGGFSRDRIVLQNSHFQLADGTLRLWGRLSEHGDRRSAQLIGDFRRLSLEQLVRAGRTDAEEMPGRLSGSFTLLGDPTRPQMFFGQGNVRIAESDLVNWDPITVLYNLMNVGAAGRQADGAGRAEFRMEGGDLNITQFSYFNRGVQVRANGVVQQLFDLPHSGVEATVVGSARPLKNLRLPLLGDVDQIFAVIQTAVTSVRVSGTVAEPRVKIISFEEIGQTMRNLLLGEVRGSD